MCVYACVVLHKVRSTITYSCSIPSLSPLPSIVYHAT